MGWWFKRRSLYNVAPKPEKSGGTVSINEEPLVGLLTGDPSKFKEEEAQAA